MIYKKVVAGQTSRLTSVDHNETYGRHILDRVVKNLKIEKCLDVGCGGGYDLSIVKKYNPSAELYGIDFGNWNNDRLTILGIKPLVVNIETEKLPFADESLDFIIANQILEHTKEIFWINHEIFRCLKVGGNVFIGVPNVLSFHNRLLMLFGFHPTCNKMISAHVRVFSKRDVKLFYNEIGNSFCRLDKFYGSQFYPFPKSVARFLSRIFPAHAVASFYLIRKTDKYSGEFLRWLEENKLETNYFLG